MQASLMSSVTDVHIKGFFIFFFLIMTLWNVSYLVHFHAYAKKAGILSQLFLSIKGKCETRSNLSDL